MNGPPAVPQPLRLNVAEILRRPATRKAWHGTARLDDLRVSDAWVPGEAEIDVDVVLESLSGALTVSGTITAPYRGECRRCLGPVHGLLSVAVREVFESHPVEGETYPLQGEQVDLEPLVRDAVLLELPVAPLCATDCTGVPGGPVVTVAGEASEQASESGSGDPDDEAEDEAEVPDRPLGDPRWAVLDALKEPKEGGGSG